jgi:hypothetical protein
MTTDHRPHAGKNTMHVQELGLCLIVDFLEKQGVKWVEFCPTVVDQNLFDFVKKYWQQGRIERDSILLDLYEQIKGHIDCYREFRKTHYGMGVEGDAAGDRLLVGASGSSASASVALGKADHPDSGDYVNEHHQALVAADRLAAKERVAAAERKALEEVAAAERKALEEEAAAERKALEEEAAAAEEKAVEDRAAAERLAQKKSIVNKLVELKNKIATKKREFDQRAPSLFRQIVGLSSGEVQRDKDLVSLTVLVDNLIYQLQGKGKNPLSFLASISSEAQKCEHNVLFESYTSLEGEVSVYCGQNPPILNAGTVSTALSEYN